MEEKNPIQVADRLFLTLELLCENAPMGLMEISTALGLNKSTTHRILNSLIYMQYVRQENSGKYSPTFKIVELAGKITSKVDIVHIIRPYLRKLMEMTGETVHLVEIDGTNAVYIDKVDSYANSIQMVSRIGRRIPLYCSGVGKALLAHMSDSEIHEIWEQSIIIQMTPHTITDFDSFMKELMEIRACGYAMDNEENEIGVRCVAASLEDLTHKAKYAFSISAPVLRMNSERTQQLAKDVLKIKKEMEYAINS